VRQRYRDLHRRLAGTVTALGVDANLAAAPLRGPGLVGACFDSAVGGEVLIDGRKTIGSAQKVVGTMLLQHGAIALADAPTPGRYRRSAPPATARSSQESRLPDADRLAEQLRADWLASGAVQAGPELTSRILQASVQHGDRFRDPGWTWRR
jgi:hypothetical protein